MEGFIRPNPLFLVQDVNLLLFKLRLFVFTRTVMESSREGGV